jgi:hypothetical protein
MSIPYNFIILSVVTLLIGCSSSSKEIYQRGYKNGVHEQVAQIRSQFNGNSFPFYHWSSPIVQSVYMPAQLVNGVMIPAHQELVLLKPGEWVMNQGYPIQNKRNSDENTTIYGDITALPSNMGNGK